MPDILIKDLPAKLHRRLKEEAEQHNCSLNEEIIWILELNLRRSGIPEVEPFVLAKPLEDASIKSARTKGRS